MAFIAGMLWGSLYGTIISIIAGLASVTTTFLISRYLIKSTAEKIISSRFPILAKKLSKTIICDWKLVAFVQMNPFFPASTMGYAFGITNVGLPRYVFFSAIFMIPSLFLCTSLGSLSLIIIDHPVYLLYIVTLAYVLYTAQRILKYYLR